MPAIDSVLEAGLDMFSQEAIRDPQRYNILCAPAGFPEQCRLLRSDIGEFAKRAFEESIRYGNPVTPR
jgi:hypothetical protein